MGQNRKPGRAELCRILKRLAQETERLAHDGDQLQTRLGCRALRSAEPELAQDLQAIDGLVRRLFNLAAFLDEVGGGEPLPARSQLSASLERLKVR
jgi:hypothetical protein